MMWNEGLQRHRGGGTQVGLGGMALNGRTAAKEAWQTGRWLQSTSMWHNNSASPTKSPPSNSLLHQSLDGCQVALRVAAGLQGVGGQGKQRALVDSTAAAQFARVAKGAALPATKATKLFPPFCAQQRPASPSSTSLALPHTPATNQAGLQDAALARLETSSRTCRVNHLSSTSGSLCHLSKKPSSAALRAATQPGDAPSWPPAAGKRRGLCRQMSKAGMGG